MKKALKRIFVVGVVVLMVIFVTARHRARMLRSGSIVQSVDQPDEADRDVAAVLRGMGPSGQPGPEDKLWVTRFAAFVNEHSGRRWVVGRSQAPCLSEAEAAEQARANATAKVFPIVVERVNVRRFDAAWLRDQVAHDIRDGHLDADRCAEQFSRPYGQVWTESVLVDVSPDRLDPFVRRYAMELRARRNRHVGHMVAAVVITGALWTAYLLINSITRGYFTTRLCLTAGVLTVAVVVLLV